MRALQFRAVGAFEWNFAPDAICFINCLNEISGQIVKQHVDFSVIVNVAKSHATPGFQWELVESRKMRDVLKSSIAIIAKEKQRLAIWNSHSHLVHLRIHMPIGH